MNIVIDGLVEPLLVTGGFGAPIGVSRPFICFADPTAFTVIE